MKTKTYNQLTEVFKLYKKRYLSPYHPLIKELVKYEDILDELTETKEDLQYAKDKGDMEEDVADLKEVVEELEGMRLKQWSYMMESFVVNTYYHPYLGD